MSKPLKVFKFGGASVKNADAVKNLSQILKKYTSDYQLLVVISAMDKTTNRLEEVLKLAHSRQDFSEALQKVKNFHLEVIQQLFSSENAVVSVVNESFNLLETTLANCQKHDFDYAYDQVVSFGELISTQIISAYLNENYISNQWVDARKCVLTDNSWRDAKVNWQWTEIFSKKHTEEILKDKVVITQGFIGSDSEGNTSTLGREGSDYSAAIFASCLQAQDVTIWKDVDGILNADPKKIKSVVKYDELSYEEVIEMSYYGASVIHPKTVKPLANKNIVLYVRSFIKPDNEGTKIANVQHEKNAPAIIIKDNQCLISFRKKDLSFMEENNISALAGALWNLKFKFNLIQKSALQFTVVCDFNEKKVKAMHTSLKEDYLVYYNTGLKLVTVKNYDTLEIPKEVDCMEVLLEQKSRKNVQFIVK